MRREVGGDGEREMGRDGEDVHADEKLAKDTGVHIRRKKKAPNKKLVWYLLDHGADPTFNDSTLLWCSSELAQDPSIVSLLRFHYLYYCFLCTCTCM
jgi:hypothetical protein